MTDTLQDRVTEAEAYAIENGAEISTHNGVDGNPRYFLIRASMGVAPGNNPGREVGEVVVAVDAGAAEAATSNLLTMAIDDALAQLDALKVSRANV